jgi:ATP-dependent DNA helicase RecG
VEDLDLNLFERRYLPSAVAADVLEQNQRSRQDQLRSLRFATSDDPPVPTVVGILSVGKDPRRFVPGSYVQFIRFDGVGVLDPIKDQREIDGPLVEMLERLDELLKVHISVAAEFRAGDLEARYPDYPLVALQQVLRNAVLHRNYEGTHAPVRLSWFRDRVEIDSPGGPFGQVTPERFGAPGVTDYRNPHLAEVLKNLGYVQRFGMGLAIVRDALEKNTNPPAEFEVNDTSIRVTIRPRGS